MAKILAIDDDPSIIALYDELLKNGGYVVSTADDPVTAVAKFHSFEPDLIICDWDMPSGGGKTFFQSLRAVMSKGVPVIFITGRDADDLGSALKFSKVAYIKKPFSRDILFGKIEEFLGSAKPTDAEPDLMTLPTVDFQGMRVLVIDHILEEVDFLQRLLVNEGCETVASPDAPAGATTLGLYKPRVVFCNWDLPLKSAAKLITTLRNTMHDNTPVIFMSEKDKAAIPEAFQAANTLYLKRPFTKPEALAAITKVLSAKIVSEAASAQTRKPQGKEPDAWATSPIAVEIPTKAALPAQQAPQAVSPAQAVGSPAPVAQQTAAQAATVVKTALPAQITAQAKVPAAAPKNPVVQAPLPAQAKAPAQTAAPSVSQKNQPLSAQLPTKTQAPVITRTAVQSPATAAAQKPQPLNAAPPQRSAGQTAMQQHAAPQQVRPQPPLPATPAQPGPPAAQAPVRQPPRQGLAQKITAPAPRPPAAPGAMPPAPKPVQQSVPVQRAIPAQQRTAATPQMRPLPPLQPAPRQIPQPSMQHPPLPRPLQRPQQPAAPEPAGQPPRQPAMPRPAIQQGPAAIQPQMPNARPPEQLSGNLHVTGHRPPLATTPRTGTPRRQALPPQQQPTRQPTLQQKPPAQAQPASKPAPRQSAVGKFFGGLFGGKKK